MLDRALWQRWGLLAVVLALAVLFVGVTGWTYVGLSARSHDLLRAQGAGVMQSVSSAMLAQGLAAGSGDGMAEALSAVYTEQALDGVLWLALIDADGRVLAEAGSPGTLEGMPPNPSELLSDDDRARMMVPPPPPDAGPGAPADVGHGPGAAPVSEHRRPPRLVIDFEPTLARQLQAGAARALFTAILAALVLVGLALASFRARSRSEAAEREVARTRHLATLGQMSAVLAHELRNPLTSLKGHAQLLAEGSPEGRKRRRAERVVKSAERLEALINDLLSFARTAELNRSAVSPSAPLEAALEGLDRDRVDVTSKADGTVSIDQARMAQVLANLVANALQHSPPERSVYVTILRDADQVEWQVRDHGPGVPVGDREDIFEPFVTRRQRGTGLGLPVARRICQLHGGTVRVCDPDDGEGAVFIARIPEA